ncbi:uncharacterized protein LOC125314841 [Rhodamnia argentea]|uniref:Uncharacterized protein LOC125314841 n=1 Tax=Rhodamnia argentea TaxID=178133 RepID=A0ABM3HBP6_9MYRT|nr:uncharacterized protein LOC125314841 [Rhodamnia argentea]
MATVAAETVLWCVVDGSLSMNDVEIKRRPYHRNCGCAFHKLKGNRPTACSHHENMSFPKRELSGNCSLSMAASKFSSHSSLLNGKSETEDLYILVVTLKVLLVATKPQRMDSTGSFSIFLL